MGLFLGFPNAKEILHAHHYGAKCTLLKFLLNSLTEGFPSSSFQNQLSRYPPPKKIFLTKFKSVTHLIYNVSDLKSII